MEQASQVQPGWLFSNTGLALGYGGVGCEGSAAGFLVDVAGRSGITDTGLEPSVDADSGVEAVGAGDGCSSGV